MSGYNRSILREYADLNTIPALLSAAYLIATLFAFGGLGALTVQWGFAYTLTAEHAMIMALGTYVIAFASSETKQFKYYTDVEKVLIAAGPALLLLYHYGFFGITWSNEMLIGAFVVSVVSWVVTVR